MADQPIYSHSNQTKKKIITYYPEWAIYQNPSFKPGDIDINLVTHINYAFAKTDVQGNISLFDEWAAIGYRPDETTEKPYWGNFRELFNLKQQHPHIKILISIGGWTLSDPLSKMASNDQTRQKFVKNIIEFCNFYGFDGIDLDWEYPGFAEHNGKPEDTQNFTLLLKELYEAAKAHNPPLLVTIAAPAGPKHMENIQLDQIHQYVDWVNLMAYDFHGPWGETADPITNHNAPLYAPENGNPRLCVEAAVAGYLAQGFTPEKIVLGIPLYGRSFANANSTNTGLFSSYQGPGSQTTGADPGMRFFSDIQKNLLSHKSGYQRYWDDQAKVPYLHNPQTKDFISYDDEQSIRLKIEYINKHQLAGAMVWEISLDVKPGWEAMRTINSTLE